MFFEFYKIHGNGNDFIVVENQKKRYNNWSSTFIQQICSIHTGIGADGLLFLEDSKSADFKMKIYNSDGYETKMCSNGSRCISYLAYKQGIVKDSFKFEANDGIHVGKITGMNTVKVQVILSNNNDPKTFPSDFLLPKNITFKKFINTGVPHVVLECKNIDSVDVREIGKNLRYHSYYQPEGTNINFVELIKNNRELKLKVRTYERGVEAETLACGTGVTASSLSFFDVTNMNSSNIDVETNGGKLSVSISKDLHDIYIEGPVKMVFKGTYIEEGYS